MAELIDRTGASVLIPTEYSREIIQSLPTQSAALQLMRSMRMSSKQKSIPALAALPIAGWVSGDTGLKVTTKMSWENKVLTAAELAAIVPVPESVLADSDFDIWGEVRPRIVEAMGAALDAAVFFGVNFPADWSGAKSLVAVANDAGNNYVAGSVGGQRLDVDVSEAMLLVESDGFPVDGMAASIPVKGKLRGLRDANGQPIIQTNANQRTIYDVPLHYINNGTFLTAAALGIVGDFTQALLAIREDVTMKLLDQAVLQDTDGAIAYNLAQQDMVALRVTMRMGFQVANPITRLNTNNSTRAPFAVLRPVGWTP